MYESNPKIWNKYFWVANYHNYFCDNAKDIPYSLNSYKIPQSFLIAKPSQIIE